MPVATANGKKFTFPEGTTPEQMSQVIEQHFSQNPVSNVEQDADGNRKVDTIDTPWGSKIDRYQNDSFVGDMADMWGAGSGSLVSGLGWLFDSEELSQLGESTSQYWQKTLSDAQQKANAKSYVNDDWSVGDAVFDPRSWAGSIAQSLPMMAAGVGAAGLTAKGAMAAGASKATAAKLAAITGSAAEGTISAAMVGDDIQRTVMDKSQVTEEMLLESPYYQDQLRLGKTPEEARKLTAEKAAGTAALPVGITTAILGTAANKFVGDAAVGALSNRMFKEAGKGFLLEGGTELLQSGAEAAGSQYALNEYANQDYNPAGIANDMVAGFAAGSALGAGVGAAGSINGETQDEHRARMAREKVAEAGGDSLDQSLAAAEEVVNPSPLEGFGTTPERQAEIEALKQRRMDRLMDAQGNLDPEYFTRGMVPETPEGPVEFESQEIPEASERPAFSPNGSEIEFEPTQPESILNMDEPATFGNEIDYEPPQAPSRMDELAKNVEFQVRARDMQPKSILLSSPDDIKMPGPVAGNANTGMDQMPENVGRMDSDRLARDEARRKGFQEETKKEIAQKRAARMPANLRDNRLLNPAYRTELENEANRFEKRFEVNKKKQVSNQHDDLFTAIAKLGGLKSEELIADGVDPEDMKGVRSGIRPVFKKEGRTMDDMAEVLVEEGYLKERDVAELREKVDAQLSGKVQKSMAAEGMQELDGILPDDMGTNAEVYRALRNSLEGKKLTEKQLGIVQRALDVINSTRNDQVDGTLKERIERNEFRTAVRDYDNQVAQSLMETEVSRGNAETQLPLDVYADIDRAQLETDEQVSSTEIDAAAAEFYALDNGLTEEQLNTLSSRYEDNAAYVQSIYREVQNNAASRQSEGAQTGQVAAREEEAGRASTSDAAQVVGSGQGDGSRSGSTEQSNAGQQEELLSTYTESDIQGREQRQQAQQKAEQQAEEKAAADAQVDSFELTGSDRPADANPAQTDLLDSQAEKSVNSSIEPSQQERIASGEIPTDLQPKYQSWLRSLDDANRKRLFDKSSSKRVRNAEYMGWATRHDEDGKPKDSPPDKPDTQANKAPSTEGVSDSGTSESKPLSDVKLSRKAKVQETGDVVTIEEPAEAKWRQMQKRGETLKALLDCVRS